MEGDLTWDSELCTWNLYNFIIQCYPKKSSIKKGKVKGEKETHLLSSGSNALDLKFSSRKPLASVSLQRSKAAVSSTWNTNPKSVSFDTITLS